jgi:hypothetical protein
MSIRGDACGGHWSGGSEEDEPTPTAATPTRPRECAPWDPRAQRQYVRRRLLGTLLCGGIRLVGKSFRFAVLDKRIVKRGGHLFSEVVPTRTEARGAPLRRSIAARAGSSNVCGAPCVFVGAFLLVRVDFDCAAEGLGVSRVKRRTRTGCGSRFRGYHTNLNPEDDPRARQYCI